MTINPQTGAARPVTLNPRKILTNKLIERRAYSRMVDSHIISRMQNNPNYRFK